MRVALFFYLTFIIGLLQAQTKAPIYSNEFLSIGAGARGIALGGAQASFGQAEEGGYWNPALLADVEAPYVSFMHSLYFGGVAAYDYASIATQIDSVSGASITLIRLGVDDIPDTRLLYDAGGLIDYNRISFFSAVDLAILFSYGRKFEKWGGIQAGGSLKIIRRTAGNLANAWGFGFDLGIKKDFPKGKLGLVLRDATSTFNVWSHTVDLLEDVYQYTGNTLAENSTEITLPSLTFGGAKLLFDRTNWKLMVMQDWKMTFDGKRNVLVSSNAFSLDPSIGGELNLKDVAFIRAGLNKIQKVEYGKNWRAEPAVGIGFKYSQILFNYAINRNNGFENHHYTHSFSLNWKLNKK